MTSESKERVMSGKKKTNQLLNKEEEFIRMNAELEAKTASLINEAESVLRGQDKHLSENKNTVDVFESERSFQRPDTSDSNAGKKSQNSQRPKSGQIKKKIPNSARGVSKEPNQQKTKKTNPSGSRPSSKIAQPSAGFDKLDSSGFALDVFQDRVNFANTISTLEQEMADENYEPSRINEGVLPDVANEMNPEAVTRFLKAKLRVMQEEMDRVNGENEDLAGKVKTLEGKVKELSSEQQLLQKGKSSLQIQVDKWKKLYEESKQKNVETEQQVSQMKKDIDSLKREKKQAGANLNALEVRLNRALEETEKHRSALQRAKDSSKDINEQERKKIDQVIADSKKLERQKNELMTAFKKQMKLIDILKRQKMHVEAAKMLQFTEEEFVKALDWGS